MKNNYFIKKTISSILIGAASVALLSSCGSIIQEYVDPYELQALKYNELEEDVYYVKSGTDFYKVYAAPGSAGGMATKVDETRLFWLNKDESLVPTLYKGEVIAYSSTKKEITGAQLERYYDVGYSIGVQGMEWDEANSQFDFDITNATTGSNSFTTFSEDESEFFSIVSINDQITTQDMANDAGVFTCMEQDKAYDIGYYSGTYYKEATITASTHMLQMAELYYLDNVEATKNGYIEIKLPDYLKTGWYKVAGAGIFKYIDHERDGSPDPVGDEWNDPFFLSTEASYSYAQRYSVHFDYTTSNVFINVSVDSESIENDQISITALSPDGTEYELTGSGGRYTVQLDKAIAGTWYVFISPKTISVIDVAVDSSQAKEEATVVEKTIEVDEDVADKTFEVLYTGEGEVHATLIAPTGLAYDLKSDSYKDGRLYYNMSFVPKGTYTIKVYHYTDTNIESVDMIDTGTDTNEDVISVTG